MILHTRALRTLRRLLRCDPAPRSAPPHRPARNVSQHSPEEDYPPDFDEVMRALFESVKTFTMTSKERIFALCKGVEYIVQHSIHGDIVECGVWKGGSMMAVAYTLMRLKAVRHLYLFDTFEGTAEPTGADRDFRGEAAIERLKREDRDTGWGWAYSPLEEVKENLLATGYDEQKMTFVKGKVEDTLPENAPRRISLLRLDTDWYASTYHALQHLYPRLSVGGALIIDDYGHWLGARKAVDQYISENGLGILLHRIDYTARICVKWQE